MGVLGQEKSLEYRVVEVMHLIEKGRLSESESLLESIIRETPDSAMYWSLYAYVTGCFGREAEYRKAIEAAKKLVKDDGIVMFNIGVAMKRAKDPSWKGFLKKASKLDKALNDKVKVAMNEDYPTVLIVYPLDSDSVLQIIRSGSEGPQISRAKPVDHEVDVIPGMIRTIRGRFLRDTISQKAGYQIGSVFLKLEDLTLEMRYGPDSIGEIPQSGAMVTVSIEDGRMPRIVEISQNIDELLLIPAYTEVPTFNRQGRWPKMCCGCGEIELKRLKLHSAKWDGEIKIPKTKQVIEAQQKTSWAKIGVAALGYVIGALFEGQINPQITRTVAREISDRIPEEFDYYLKELELLDVIKMHLSMKLYLCETCKKEKKDMTTYVSIAPRDFDDGFPALKFEFRNDDFTRVFHDHNPEGIYAEVSSETLRKKATTLGKVVDE